MPSLSSNQQSTLHVKKTLILPKIAVVGNHTIGCHLARIVAGNADNFQSYIKSMYTILQPDNHLTLMVQLESGFPNRFRYLVIITCIGKQQTEESALLGFDVTSSEITIGMTLPIWADLDISLDGDG
ncbi:unnamed protein product [Rotaria magnacalcarata]|nr:unnamed protein product [Rotaria magnacalcarata]